MADHDPLQAAAQKFPVGRNVHYYPVPTSSNFVASRVKTKPWIREGGDVVVAIEGVQHPVSVDSLERG